MKTKHKNLILLFAALMFCSIAQPVFADTAAEIDQEVQLALEKLYAGSPSALEFSKVSKGTLVFPDVVKAGLIIGGQYGEGALFVNGVSVINEQSSIAPSLVAQPLMLNPLAGYI